MANKKLLQILACVLGGLLVAFLVRSSLNVFNQSQAVNSQSHLTQETLANSGGKIACPQDMVWIEGGTFRMGSDQHYQEERTVEGVTVDGFCMDKYEITNAQFAEFVKATGYVTIAERPLSAKLFPTLSEAQRVPGSVAFVQPPVQKSIPELSWWHWTPGANWRHPDGPNSSIQGQENYPVIHVAYEDAAAYAKWAGKSLPTEPQWEFAARGGLKNMTYTWGDEYSAKKANTWQGFFPFYNTKEDGYLGTAPIGSFPPNGYGLYDMAGNVWEWTEDWYRVSHQGMAHKLNPTVSNPAESLDPREPNVAKHVIKGGSYLCAPNYCSRFRPAAREAQSPDTGTSHIGFRLVKIPAAPTT